MAAIPAERFAEILAEIPNYNPETLVKLFLQARERKAKLQKAHDLEVGQIDQLMKISQACMMGHADKMGQTGFSTADGTTYTSVSMKVSVADPLAFRTWLDSLPPEADKYGFFEQRIAAKRVEEVMKAGVQVPGLNVFRERTMRVRKAGDKGESN